MVELFPDSVSRGIHEVAEETVVVTMGHHSSHTKGHGDFVGVMHNATLHAMPDVLLHSTALITL